MDTFLDGLVAYDVSSSLDGAIDLAIRVDLQVQDRRRERLQMRHLVMPEEFPTDPPPRPAASAGEEEPMQLGRNSLTGVERRQQLVILVILSFCGDLSGKRPNSPVTGGIVVSPIAFSPQQPHLSLQVRFLLPGGPHDLAALVDSGADTCLIGGEVVWQPGLTCEPLASAVLAQVLDGDHLGDIRHRTGPVTITLQPPGGGPVPHLGGDTPAFSPGLPMALASQLGEGEIWIGAQTVFGPGCLQRWPHGGPRLLPSGHRT